MTHSPLSLFALVAVLGCASTPAPAPATPATTPAAATPAPAAAQRLVPPGEARVGDRTTCPISNEEFVVTADSPHTEYEGRTYYFCCAPCVERFRAAPQQYIRR